VGWIIRGRLGGFPPKRGSGENQRRKKGDRKSKETTKTHKPFLGLF